MKAIAIAIFAVSFSLTGCKKKEQESMEAEPAAKPAEQMEPAAEQMEPAVEQPATPEPAAVAAAAQEALTTGIAVCDQLVTKYTACLNEKAPADVRDESLKAFNADVSKWAADAKDPANLEALTKGCTERTAELTTKSEGWGCQW